MGHAILGSRDLEPPEKGRGTHGVEARERGTSRHGSAPWASPLGAPMRSRVRARELPRRDARLIMLSLMRYFRFRGILTLGGSMEPGL